MYNASTISMDADAAALEAVGAALGFYIFFGIVVGLLMLVSMWKIFTKAGKPGWAAIIPIYNTVVLFQIVGLNPWLVLTAFIPPVYAVLSIIAIVKLAGKFGKGTGFAVGMIFLSVIFIPMLAFGKSEYQG